MNNSNNNNNDDSDNDDIIFVTFQTGYRILNMTLSFVRSIGKVHKLLYRPWQM